MMPRYKYHSIGNQFNLFISSSYSVQSPRITMNGKELLCAMDPTIAPPNYNIAAHKQKPLPLLLLMLSQSVSK